MDGRRFANTVLVAGAFVAASGSLLALGIGRVHEIRTLRSLLLTAASLVLAAGFLAALRLPTHHRINVALSCVSVGVVAYAAEFYLKDLPDRRTRWLASRLGVEYDPRTKIEVLRDMRRMGVDAWPAVPAEFLVATREQSDLLPLGGIARVVTVLCNEIGSYLVYQSDEHGFHNPSGLWSSGTPEVAALGDSYTEGRCVPSEQNLVALIRRRYPATLNLGMSGNGPLTELAGLREYLSNLRPRRVLWIYFEGNDLLDDLARDRRDPLLPRYLDPGFRQGLSSRQPEIDALLKKRVEAEYWKMEETVLRNRSGDRWEGFFRLRALRAFLGFAIRTPPLDASRLDYGLFRQIVAEAGKNVGGWGGRLYFVYLPAPGRYASPHLRRLNDEVRAKVLAILRELDIALIDLVDVFGKHVAVTELYTPTGGHFTPRGYALAADTVLRALEKQPDDLARIDRRDPG